ncbi:ral guanine nucleotide dissociation stimulator-like 3 [Ochotona princeps]|uniref:ral guanine nucleotide dissociation stimulator-like 3 n=1 Tax=Ochotona princeps TaxID=9978 RepID=UPI002714EC40|nr:ral guanine nucleotide dissociation stimulator-like 3 [Ochotona princeps]XP_058514018.1 ral guanine nucleotide dissociation stimulator-like 3 [Ochotona princeps]
MERSAGARSGRELALAPVQDWGEETEDGAVYSVSLHRQRSQHLSRGKEGPGGGQPSPAVPETFLHYRTSKVRALRAAPLERLLRELVSGDREQDPGFVPAFLATHRAFVPTGRVLGFLLPPPPPPPPPGQDLKRLRGQDLGCNKNLRAVVSLLGCWLRDHPQDFREPPAHSNLAKVQVFLSWAAPGSPEAQDAEKLLEGFLKEVEQEQQEEEKPPTWAGLAPDIATQPRSPASPESSEEEEAAVPPEGPQLLDFSVDEVAEQLTLLDVELFQHVRPCECLGSVWSQRDRPGAAGVAPTVRATVTQFNMVTGCVLGSVLGAPGQTAAQRALHIEKWIRIAQRCRELQNFASLRAILSALQCNPVYRLKHSWAAVSREPLSTFRKLSQIFSDENNHVSCRAILSQEEATEEPQEDGAPQGSLTTKPSPGPVPYLGTFLTDLVMLDTALPDMLEGGLINFEKRRKEWEILSRIQQLQRRCRSHSLSPRPAVLAALRAQRQLSEEQSYRVSRVIEPPAASCPSSPHVRRRFSLTKRLSAKLSREKSSSLAGSPSSPSPSLSPTSPPSSPRAKDPPPRSPPASPGPQDGSTKLPWSTDLPGPQSLTLALSSGRSALAAGQQQASGCRVIRVSLDNDHGNLYRSILLTSQDKAPSVVQRALQKHNVPESQARDYQLSQVLSGDRELLIPDNANVFYAMRPSSPGDFVLRRKQGAPPAPSGSPT